MTKKTKQQRLIDDMTERYNRLGTHRAVESELQEQYGESASYGLIAQVVAGAWSPKLARIVGIEPRRTRWSADCSEKLRDAINEQCEFGECTHGELLLDMFKVWLYDSFAEEWEDD